MRPARPRTPGLLLSISLAALPLLAPLAGFIGAQHNATEATRGPYNVYAVTDLHLASPLGGQNGLRQTRWSWFIDTVNSDPNAAAVLFGGDLTYQNDLSDTAEAEWRVSTLTDSFNVDVFVAYGNHELDPIACVKSEWQYDGTLLNQYAMRFPDLFQPSVSPSHPGRFWYAADIRQRGKPTHSKLFVMNNNAEESLNGYRVYTENNPDGYGVNDSDFTGIRSASPQRDDLAAFISTVTDSDIVFVMGHRSAETNITTVGRTTQDRCPVTGFLSKGGALYDLDKGLANPFFWIQGDMHEVMWMAPAKGQNHYTIATSVAQYAVVRDSLKAKADRLLFFAYRDTVHSRTGLAESVVGRDGSGLFRTWPLMTPYVRFTVDGDSVTVMAFGIFDDPEPVLLDSMRVAMR